MTEAAQRKELAEQISNMLGLYKAEWLNGKLFELFTEPGYFGELKTNRPCVLIGGRGTGKTTVLRGLSYQGQFALSNGDAEKVRQWTFVGLYYRVNTNRVTAFRGAELSEARWISLFAHYMNLVFCSALLDFSAWYESITGRNLALSNHDSSRFRASLRLQKGGSEIAQLREDVQLSLVEFEGLVNSIGDAPPPELSLQAAPIDSLTDALLRTQELSGKQFYFLIDEFENFEDYQQRVLNTIIKHASSTYTFKVGVRELGWRQRATLNAEEQLTSPADYARINIGEVFKPQSFKVFAERVISSRIQAPLDKLGLQPLDPSLMFPGLTEHEEASLLLDQEDLDKIRAKFKSWVPSVDAAVVDAMRPGELFFVDYWAGDSPDTLTEALRSWTTDGAQWKTRFNNHFHASLFTIRRRKRGIRKHYCGWDVFLALANGNIRYLLELVHATYKGLIEFEKDPLLPVPAEIQTRAAEQVGKKNLSELEGLSVDGARLTKLLLSLGRVFGVLAEQPKGHTPEVNQFHLREIPGNSGDDAYARKILDRAVMHLALVRSPGSKLTDEVDTREYDYSIHPIFAPFFVFSHRRKRKLTLDSAQLIALIERPREGIREVLTQNNRDSSQPLPDQLKLFGTYYEGI